MGGVLLPEIERMLSLNHDPPLTGQPCTFGTYSCRISCGTFEVGDLSLEREILRSSARSGDFACLKTRWDQRVRCVAPTSKRSWNTA